MTRSLKRRMLVALSAWVVIAWCVSFTAMYLYTAYSQSSIWDERFTAIAENLLLVAPLESPGVVEGRPAKPSKQWIGMQFQVWREGVLIARTAHAPRAALRPDFADGFASVPIDGETWRVYSISDEARGIRAQVGAPRAVINADFRRHSLRAISFAAIPLVIGGLLLWWSVQRALRPLANIEATARARSIADLTPLPTADLPLELLPIVESFNQLLQRLDASIQAERRFIGDAAHELRTPLAALQTQLEVALRASPEDRDGAFEKVQSAVERTVRLAEQLLDLARLEAGARLPIRNEHDLDEILRHVVNEFEVSAQRQQRHIELATERCRVVCDVDEIGILVRNLVDNALRYTRAGGQVRVSCGQRMAVNGKRTFIEVVDDGPGVPLEERAAIFERFHRVKGSSGVRGSGIGLSLVAKIAELHRAKIETSAGLRGAGFGVTVTFPS